MDHADWETRMSTVDERTGLLSFQIRKHLESSSYWTQHENKTLRNYEMIDLHFHFCAYKIDLKDAYQDRKT